MSLLCFLTTRHHRSKIELSEVIYVSWKINTFTQNVMRKIRLSMKKCSIRMSSLYTYWHLTSQSLFMLTELHVFFKQIDQNHTSKFAFVPWHVGISKSSLHQSFHIAIHVIVTILVITAWNATRMTKLIELGSLDDVTLEFSVEIHLTASHLETHIL